MIEAIENLIEQFDPDQIPLAARSRLALRREKRWWPFGMAAISGGGFQDGEYGGRVTLHYALGGGVQKTCRNRNGVQHVAH